MVIALKVPVQRAKSEALTRTQCRALAASSAGARVARYAGPRPVSCIYRIDNTDTVNTYCKQPALATGRPTCPYPTRLQNARTVYAYTESTSTYRNLVPTKNNRELLKLQVRLSFLSMSKPPSPSSAQPCIMPPAYVPMV